MNDEQSNRYQTYLLRLWRAQCRGTCQWRASLESRHTGERQLFASLEQLFAFLGERCDSQTPRAGHVPRIIEEFRASIPWNSGSKE
jgi:hypothetical protein